MSRGRAYPSGNLAPSGVKGEVLTILPLLSL
jgi:hypothetical protein